MFSKYQSQSLSFQRQWFSFWKTVMSPSKETLHHPPRLELLPVLLIFHEVWNVSSDYYNKIPRLSGLKRQTFLIGLEAGSLKSKSRMIGILLKVWNRSPGCWGSGRTLPGLQMTHLLTMSSHDRERELRSLPPRIRALIPSRGPTLLTSSKSSHLLRATQLSHWVLSFQHMNLGERHSVHNSGEHRVLPRRRQVHGAIPLSSWGRRSTQHPINHLSVCWAHGAWGTFH